MQFLEELTNALDTIISSRCSIAIFSTIGDTFCSGLDISFLIEILKSPKKHDCTALKMTEIVGLVSFVHIVVLISFMSVVLVH